MMPPVFALLSAAAPVTAIIGTAPVRAYPAGVIPQNADGTANNALMPAITWQLVTGIPENYLCQAPTIDRMRVQVDCWALTLSAADALGNAARTALEDGAANTVVALNGHDYEPDTKRFRVSFDIEIWVSR